jgi:hypothetical protein
LTRTLTEVAAEAETDLRTVFDVALRGELSPTGRQSRTRSRIARVLREKGVHIAAISSRPGLQA